jgi:hypothetical protein
MGATDEPPDKRGKLLKGFRKAEVVGGAGRVRS